jgi:hypothetical protein
MDINGLAGSLELYFGLDVLRDGDGNLSPVQWRGYVDGVKRYQGEILDKARLQARFREKLRSCREEPRLIESTDWEGMRAILDRLRSAFHDDA